MIGWMEGHGIKPKGKSMDDERLGELGILGF